MRTITKHRELSTRARQIGSVATVAIVAISVGTGSAAALPGSAGSRGA
ncbi:hypothetical protein ABTX24_11475 [Nocardioides sp. NPDC127514]